jgi:hypothetical protein
VSEQPKMVVGRVVDMGDGTKSIVPLSHKEEVIAHQGAIRELIEAARAYSERPSQYTLRVLKQAAHRI